MNYKNFPGGLPSDMDGDDQKTSCWDCGCLIWQSESFIRVTEFGNEKTLCKECYGEDEPDDE